MIVTRNYDLLLSSLQGGSICRLHREKSHLMGEVLDAEPLFDRLGIPAMRHNINWGGGGEG